MSDRPSETPRERSAQKSRKDIVNRLLPTTIQETFGAVCFEMNSQS